MNPASPRRGGRRGLLEDDMPAATVLHSSSNGVGGGSGCITPAASSRPGVTGSLEVMVYRAKKLPGWQYIGQYMRSFDKVVRDANQGSHVLGAPDVYARLRVHPGTTQEFETSTQLSAYNPIWQEQFRFDLKDVQQCPQLRISVFDEASSELVSFNPLLRSSSDSQRDMPCDKLLGIATLVLDANELQLSKRRWRARWLSMKTADGGAKDAGQLQVWVRWEPYEGMSVSSFLEEQWNSQSACQGVGFSHTGLAAIFLFVACFCSFLKSPGAGGDVSLPGATGFTLFAAIHGTHAALFQMLGAAGVWHGWRPGFPGFSMASDEDTDAMDGDGKVLTSSPPALVVTGSLLTGMRISMAGNLFSRVPLGPIHVLTWMWQIGTSLFSFYALVLVLIKAATEGCRFGEAAYISLAANWFNVIAVLHLRHAGIIQRQNEQELQESLVAGGAGSGAHFVRRHTRNMASASGSRLGDFPVAGGPPAAPEMRRAPSPRREEVSCCDWLGDVSCFDWYMTIRGAMSSARRKLLHAH